MDQLTIPNKLYGRDRDITIMLESFERISRGCGEVLLVPGTSGVGKTALVQELQMPVLTRNGFFIKGKFDQYKQNIPYFGFRQALAELCRELQSGNAAQRSRLKADILLAIGSLGQVLVDMVPEFESFIGAQPPLEDISPQEARYRFAGVFRNFLKVICRPEHPLVLFIDDWQWADTASFELLKQIQVGNAIRYLMVIISYRDNEVDSGHPLMFTINDLQSHFVPVNVLQVNNITLNDLKELVADTLRPAAAEDIDGLAAIIHTKTLGNPFFLRSFLAFLYDANLIYFDYARKFWRSRIDEIGKADLPGSVVELFVLKLQCLGTDHRYLFTLAACLGNTFDLETLSLISGRNSGECLALLLSNPAKDMLLPVESDGDDSPSEELHVPKVFRFLHDRVQQAAYSLIEPAERPNILLKIGRILLASLHPEKLAERLFEVVNNLNAGFVLIQDDAEQVKVVELNERAARKAFAASAYRSALQFYRAANRFLEAPGFVELLWRDHHELAMSLFIGRAECEFLEGDRNAAEKCNQQAAAHSRTPLEKADVLNHLIVQYTLLSRYPEAIATGRLALAILGINLPEDDYEEARNHEIAMVRKELEIRSVSSLAELPVMSNPEMLMASKILIMMGPPCYRSHQRLWGVIVPKVVNLTIHYGNIPQVGYSHTAFGGLLGWVDNDYATAKAFSELATRLMTGTFRSPSDQSVFFLMIGSSMRHWFRHLRYGTLDYTDAYEIGLRSGNLQYAAYAFGHKMYCRFYQGIPLADLIQETERSLEFSRTRFNQWAIDLFEGGLKVFDQLLDESALSNRLDARPEKEYLQRVADHHNIQVICIYKVLKTFSLLLSGDYNGALVLSDEAETLIYTVGTQGLLPWPEHVFARLLILTSLYSTADGKRQKKWRTELDQMMGRLRIWADNCPENFLHKYLLAAAELARIDARLVEAMELYDKAIEAAQADNFLQWEGMANERAHSFWLEFGNEGLSHFYWQQAYVCYTRWGAAAKVCSMEAAYRKSLDSDLTNGKGAGNLTDKRGREIQKVLVEKQIKQLRNCALQMQQSRLRIEASTQAEELAHAMHRLRMEIAERKRTEAALRESEAQYRLLADNVSDVIWTMDLKQRFTYVSPSVQKLMGYTPEESLQVPLKDTLTPESYVKVVQVITKAITRAGEPGISPDVTLSLELEHIRKDGGTLWVEITTSFIRDEDGLLSGFIGISREITERKQAEKQRDKLISDLQKALGEVKTLSKLLPICSYCKNIRDDKGDWSKLESYIHKHSDTQFSHGICPECAKKYYPDMDLYRDVE